MHAPRTAIQTARISIPLIVAAKSRLGARRVRIHSQVRSAAPSHFNYVQKFKRKRLHAENKRLAATRPV